MKFAFNVLLGIVILLFAGFITSHMWEWFVMTRFSVGPITFKEASGLLFFVSFVTRSLTIAPALGDVISAADVTANLKTKMSHSSAQIYASLLVITIVFPFIYVISWLLHIVMH